MNKINVIDKVITELKEEIALAMKAQHETFEAATDEDAYSDGKYDTRSLEASYLASGQAQIIKELGDALQAFKLLRTQQFIQPPTQRANLGSLLEIKSDNTSAWYLLGSGGGGMEVIVENLPILVLTLHSPLGQKVVNKQVGDSVTLPDGEGIIVQII
ncbi:MAG: hypothetical protein O3C43_04570 [Verrucomicrobia bacterium]|nr:hypothetical protein [Verrucomicrobiota bacterium]MDA1065758.1 hypothetical protein [Verrucomicrobiota bacterium]